VIADFRPRAVGGGAFRYRSRDDVDAGHRRFPT
jgi:hypothetical protein